MDLENRSDVGKPYYKTRNSYNLRGRRMMGWARVEGRREMKCKQQHISKTCWNTLMWNTQKQIGG